MPRLDQEITIDKIYEEILNSRFELKNIIEASEARVLLKIEELKNKVKTLEEENLSLKIRLEEVDRTKRKNNILLFGLERQAKEVSIEFVTEKIQNLLDIRLKEADVNNAYYLGNLENSPLKVELVSFLKKKLILENCKKLKGSDIYISNDLTEKQREEFKRLRQHLSVVKRNSGNHCYIRSNKLYINNKPHTLEELEADKEVEKYKPSSAPATPDVSRRNVTEEAIDKLEEGKVIEKLTTKKGVFASGRTELKNQQKPANQQMKEKLRHRSVKE